MLDWLAEKIGFISMAPWLRPTIAFALSIVSSSLGWFASDRPWATWVFVLSVALAVWAFAESVACTVSGFVVSFVGFYLLLGLTNTLPMLRPTHYGCVAIDGETTDDCMDAVMKKALRQSPSN